MLRATFFFAVFTTAALPHPMGNFSVSHYARIEPAAPSSRLTYVLDLAEIPTFELFQQWSIDGKNESEVTERARRHATEWLSKLEISQEGRRIPVRQGEISTHTSEGAGGLPVLRVVIKGELELEPGRVDYRDRNYEGRAGWKEIVVRAGDGARVEKSTSSARERSAALTAYPADSGITPPQDERATFTWGKVTVAASKAPEPAPLQAPMSPAKAARGEVVRGDFLSKLLSKEELGWRMIVLGLLAAFGLGAMHALSPGHGKTIVAAYLVGTRGTAAQALFLGGMVTFTHTVSVFLLGIGVLFFQRQVAPERIIPVLGAVSGLSIVVIGATLLYKRTKALALADAHAHAHSHSHGGGHSHSHSHGGSSHSHYIPGSSEVSIGGLIALGASGGLVPCPSALILMLSAIALGRTALGLGLLVSFSAGLALVLTAIGLLVIYAKHLLPESESLRRGPLFRFAPVFSAFVVMALGVIVTVRSIG